jgi:predicted deacylase
MAFRLVPLAGYTLHSDLKVLEAQRKMAIAFNLPLVCGTSAKLNGRSLSVARDANVPAIYTEFGGGEGSQPEVVQAYVAGCLNVMRELAMLEMSKPENRVEQIVEDDRDQSGHLQLHHPSPADGFFEPAVSLGEHVSAGATLGSVCDALGQNDVVVRAQHSGMVMMLRAINAVKQGDALVALLPDDAPRRPI